MKLALKGTDKPVHVIAPETLKAAKFAVMLMLLRLPCGAPVEMLVGVVAPNKLYVAVIPPSAAMSVGIPATK